MKFWKKKQSKTKDHPDPTVQDSHINKNTKTKVEKAIICSHTESNVSSIVIFTLNGFILCNRPFKTTRFVTNLLELNQITRNTRNTKEYNIANGK